MFSGTFFEAIQKHLMMSVQYDFASVLAQFSRAEFSDSCTEIKDGDLLSFGHYFQEEACTEIEAAFAWKTRQPAGLR